eukprot:scaffold1194_cov127-Cylindrotheca_fusiformis.AAC.32
MNERNTFFCGTQYVPRCRAIWRVKRVQNETHSRPLRIHCRICSVRHGASLKKTARQSVISLCYPWATTYSDPSPKSNLFPSVPSQDKLSMYLIPMTHNRVPCALYPKQIFGSNKNVLVQLLVLDEMALFGRLCWLAIGTMGAKWGGGKPKAIRMYGLTGAFYSTSEREGDFYST